MGKLSTLIVGFLLSVTCAASTTSIATDRVISFLTNAHTGKQMRADEWLTKKTRSAEMFVAFGGLDALVRQSTSSAESYGGLRSVRILVAKREGNTHFVTAEVQFKEDYRRRQSPVAAEREDMVWQFRVVSEDGVLKLSF